MKQFLHLWVPIFLSNTIIMLGGLFDTIFLSHFAAQHVAVLAVCLSIYSLIFVSGMGMLQGSMQELAEANGRQAPEDIQRIVKQSILIIAVLSGVAIWLLNHADPLLTLLKADDALKALIQPCLVLLAWTIPAHLMLRVLYILTQSCGQAKRVFYSNMLYLMVKVSLAYVFIFGIEGHIQTYGVAGAFIANLIAQWLLCLLYYFFFLEKHLSIQWQGTFLHVPTLFKILRIGVPNAVVTFIDVFTVSAIALLILPLGHVLVNAHQVMLGVLGLMFMLPLSLSAAFSILVSTRIGAKRVQAAWQLSRKAILTALIVALAVVSSLWGFQHSVLGLLSDDPQVQWIGLSLVIFLCWMHVFDALLVMCVSILRCWKMVVLPMLIFSSMILCVGLGGGWYLAYHPMAILGFYTEALGLIGFWWMLAIAYTCAALMCGGCLWWRHRQYLRLIEH
jgi:MATE family multidrug resistance protein